MNLAYSTNAYRKWPLEQAIARIAAIGYCGIEIMADAPHVWPLDCSAEQIDAIRRELDKAGIAVSNVNAFMTTAIEDFWHPSWIEPDPAYRKLRVEHTKAALTFAARIGASCITTEPGGPLPAGMSIEQATDCFVDGLSETLRHAEQVGVRLLVEPEPGLLIENADQFLALAERIASPLFGLNFDIGHFFCVGADIASTIARLASFTKHYHIEDITADRVHEHLVPGRGVIDFPSALQAMADTAYSDWITVELYPYLDDPDAAGREALEYLTNMMPV